MFHLSNQKFHLFALFFTILLSMFLSSFHFVFMKISVKNRDKLVSFLEIVNKCNKTREVLRNDNIKIIFWAFLVNFWTGHFIRVQDIIISKRNDLIMEWPEMHTFNQKHRFIKYIKTIPHKPCTETYLIWSLYILDSIWKMEFISKNWYQNHY